MLRKNKREFMEKLDSCYKIVQQSSAKGKGISAVEIAEQLGVHRTTVHSYLNSLEFMRKVYSEKGLWFAREPSGSIKPEEITIEITLPAYSEEERYWEEKVRENIAILKNEELKKYLQATLEANLKARTITIKMQGSKNAEALKDLVSQSVKEAYEKHRKKPFWK